MRYIVKYSKPNQVEGARIFDIPKEASQEAIRAAAEQVAGANATIKSIEKNDGTVPHESRVDRR